MKRGRVLLLVLFLLLVFGFSGSADALTTIGTATYGEQEYNLIYDEANNEKNLIWLDYSHFSPNDWISQMTWAGDLNDPGVLTYNLSSGMSVNWSGDWRLPTTVDGKYVWGENGTSNTAGFNITSSEMGDLYQNSLGNPSGWASFSTPLNAGPFENLYEYSYWSSTEYAGNDSLVWRYTFEAGANELMTKAETWPFAIAVRQGDLATTSPVPEPSMAMLLLTGLVGLVGVGRRYK